MSNDESFRDISISVDFPSPGNVFLRQHEANSEMLSHPPEQLEAFALDRQIWCDTCDSGLATFLAEYKSAAENRRVRRHQPAIRHLLCSAGRTAACLMTLYSLIQMW